MARRDEGILELLSQSPWWVSIAFSATALVILRFIVPLIGFTDPFLRGLANGAPTLAPAIAFVLLLPAPFAYFQTRRKRRMVEKQKDLESIRSLPWKELEELVAEAYHRKGYSVVENYSVGPDGGIDLVLKKDGNTFLVQCKQWKNQKVDVRVVREMYGVMNAEHATGVIIITSGVFTEAARTFAEDKAIDLIEGHQLAELIHGVQGKRSSLEGFKDTREQSEKICRRCDSKLLLRTARRGKNAGSQFWGCSNFPNCTFTEEYTASP